MTKPDGGPTSSQYERTILMMFLAHIMTQKVDFFYWDKSKLSADQIKGLVDSFVGMLFEREKE